MNPLRELVTLRRLYLLLKKHRPDLVHAVALKACFYTGLAVSLPGARRPAVLAFTGLGTLFSSDRTAYRALRVLLHPLFRLAFSGKRTHAIFQNPDDRARMTEAGLVRQERSHLIRGSGVDIDLFHPVSRKPADTVTILLAARLLWPKGIGDYAEAARLVRQKHDKVRFLLAGPLDPENPEAIGEKTIRMWENEGLIEWLGPRDDMPALLQEADIFCLPSYYAEGLPKVLLEACSCGVPIVTTDHPGCREAVIDGENGFLVPPRESALLAETLIRLAESKTIRHEMGVKGRKMAEDEFSVRHVVSRTLELYRSIRAV